MIESMIKTSLRLTRMDTYRQHGFTLIELMIVIVIVSILAGIAYPSYRNTVLKSRRSEAKIALMEIANLQERFFMENNSYSDDLVDYSDTNTTDDTDGPCRISYGTLNSGAYYTEGGYYSISINNNTAPSLAVSSGSCNVTTTTSDFTVTATASTEAGQNTDTDCNKFTIDHLGVKKSENSGGTDSDCW